MRPCVKRLRTLFSSAQKSGVAAVEFGLVAPVFILILVGVVDLSSLVIVHFQLDTAVAAGANYALLNNTQVSSSGGAALASSIASIVSTSAATSSSVVINDGPSQTLSGGSTSTGGTPGNANLCYCPTGTPTNLSWNTAVTCGSACTGGGTAGKFVLVTASYTYSPIFSSYSFVNGGVVTSGAVVQTQ